MTDNMFASAPEANEAAQAGSRRKLPILLAGGVGLAVLAGGGWMLLHGGSSDSNDTAFVVPHHAPVAKKAVVAKKATSKSTAKVTVLPAASSVKIGRDPFAALYVVPASTGTGTSGTGTTATTGTTTPTTTTAQPGTTTGTRYALTLTKVTTAEGGAKLFTFTYGTLTKTVLPAQRFGKYGELVVLTYVKNSKGVVTGAVLQVGDDNPIDVPIGMKVTVL